MAHDPIVLNSLRAPGRSYAAVRPVALKPFVVRTNSKIFSNVVKSSGGHTLIAPSGELHYNWNLLKNPVFSRGYFGLKWPIFAENLKYSHFLGVNGYFLPATEYMRDNVVIIRVRVTRRHSGVGSPTELFKIMTVEQLVGSDDAACERLWKCSAPLNCDLSVARHTFASDAEIDHYVEMLENLLPSSDHSYAEDHSRYIEVGALLGSATSILSQMMSAGEQEDSAEVVDAQVEKDPKKDSRKKKGFTFQDSDFLEDNFKRNVYNRIDDASSWRWKSMFNGEGGISGHLEWISHHLRSFQIIPAERDSRCPPGALDMSGDLNAQVLGLRSPLRVFAGVEGCEGLVKFDEGVVACGPGNRGSVRRSPEEMYDLLVHELVERKGEIRKAGRVAGGTTESSVMTSALEMLNARKANLPYLNTEEAK